MVNHVDFMMPVCVFANGRSAFGFLDDGDPKINMFIG